MRVLVTGATGFIGRNLCSLLKKKAEVCAIIRNESDRAVLTDIPCFIYRNSTQSLIDAVAGSRADVVVHLAAMVLPRHTTNQIETLIDSNILFGVRLLEAMSCCGVRRIINTSTTWQHLGNSFYKPVSLYAATKQAMEDIMAHYIEEKELRAITLILNDNYGPNDHRPKVMNLLKDAAKNGHTLEMSPGEQEMNFLYIDDVVSAFEIAVQRSMTSGNSSEVFDVISPETLSLRKVVELFGRVNGVDVPVKWGAKPYREHEIMTTYKPVLPLPGWEPQVSLERGFKLFFEQ